MGRLILDSHQLLRQPGLTPRKTRPNPDRVRIFYALHARRDSRCVDMILFATSYFRITAIQLFCVVQTIGGLANGPSREGFALSKKNEHRHQQIKER
jgi:hypothetical protein